MKKLFVLGLVILGLAAAAAEAKYVAPKDVKSRGTKVSAYMFYNQDADGDGQLTLEEFKNQRMTKDVEQRNRYLRKKGVYKTPEEQFKAMDTDKDGKITPEDLARFLDTQRAAADK